ncbi:MAG: glycine cleavage system aminomethyltransferase GcvT [Verrucomicrobiales bacterium]|nr:glycine cleavage system aminomethyltransferase GcvT [Verrucomicrobiales bacterium]
MSLLRTPLFPAHQKLGGRLIEFGGWEMPVQYSSIVDEHLCVRKASGIFDICHMGEVFLEGPQAANFLNATLGNDIRKLSVGQGQYTHLCNEHGGTVDDLYAYRLASESYLLIINASRIAPDTDWLTRRLSGFAAREGVRMDPASDRMGAVAIQGPRVVEFIGQLFPGGSEAGTPVRQVTDLKKNELGAWKFSGETLWVARTGSTGEDGFEAVGPAGVMEALWNRALAVGHVGCLQPCGLGARDTLRTEVCFPLYGHELDESTSPLEAGLGVFVSLDKGEFVGREALCRQKAEGVSRKCVAFRMVEKSAPPRPGYAIISGESPVGTVVSGTQSPSLGIGIGMGYVPPALAIPGTRIAIEIRGRRCPAEIVKKPIFRKA